MIKKTKPALLKNELIEQLRAIYSECCSASADSSDSDADQFVDALMCEAEWCVSELIYVSEEVTDAVAIKEAHMLRSALRRLLSLLNERSVSIDVMLQKGAGPGPLIDEIEAFTEALESGLSDFEKHSSGGTNREKEQAVLDELVHRSLLVFEQYGISTSASFNKNLRQHAELEGKDKYQSTAVNILTSISTAFDLPATSADGWRNRLARVKKERAKKK